MSQERQPQVIISRGNLGAQDSVFVSELLSRVGLVSQFMSEADFQAMVDQPPEVITIHETRYRSPKPFSGISSRHDFITKQGFFEYRDAYTPSTDRKIASRAFNSLIDNSPPEELPMDRIHRIEGGGILHTFPGLVVKHFDELGIKEFFNPLFSGAPYIIRLASHGIEVGSLLDNAETIASDSRISTKGLKLFRSGLFSSLAEQVRF